MDEPLPTIPDLTSETAVDPHTQLRRDILQARRELDHPTWKVQCSRVKKNGERCKRYARRGTTVCAKHGGNTPVVKAKAESRIQELKDYILHTLASQALGTVTTLLDAEDEKVRLRAAQDILDRAGLAAPKQITQDINTTHTVTHGLDDEISNLLASRGVTLPDGSPRPSHDTGPALPPPEPSQPSPRDLQNSPHPDDIEDATVIEDETDFLVPPHYAPIPPHPRDRPTEIPPE